MTSQLDQFYRSLPFYRIHTIACSLSSSVHTSLITHVSLLVFISVQMCQCPGLAPLSRLAICDLVQCVTRCLPVDQCISFIAYSFPVRFLKKSRKIKYKSAKTKPSLDGVNVLDRQRFYLYGVECTFKILKKK